jgi:demethylmenaquinone methyltransferase/2-methoxy-6-polyprenyl-1,4-benzoquinol methylase
MRELGLAKLAPKPGEVILEIGFGTGHCLVQLAKAVAPAGKVFGLDLSEGMLSETRALLEKEGVSGTVSLECGDAEHLPYADAMMDGVFMSFTLELFDTPRIPAVLAECKRVLRPGGRLAVVGMSKEGGHALMVDAYEWIHRHFPNILDCRPIFVRRSMEDAGFTILDSSLESMWVPVEIVLAQKPIGGS